MFIKYIKNISLIRASFILVSSLYLSACGGEAILLAPVDDPDQVSFSCPDMETVLTELNCTNSSCHSSTPSQAAQISLTGSIDDLAFRFNDVSSVNSNCSDEKIIDVSNPSNSLMLKLVNPHSGTQCSDKMPVGTEGVSDDYFGCFEAWVDEIANTNVVIDEPEKEPFVPLPAKSGLNKVKTLLHGAALTDEEINQAIITEDALDKDQLVNLIDKWMETEEFDEKFQSFLQLALQQKNVNTDDVYRAQLDVLTYRVIDGFSAIDNLESSFVRTAYAFVQNDEDFRQVATTRKWQVTTAMLLALRYADYENRLPFYTEENSFELRSFEHLCGDLEDEAGCDGIDDYSDWRTVEFLNRAEPAAFTFDQEMAQSLRAIPDGGSIELVAPRVGYFTTPTFLQSWLSNTGNKFRVTANQTVIAGLGLSYEAGDITPSGDLTALDTEHAGEDAPECFACHRMMDPMRQVFDNEYTLDHSRAILNKKDIPAAFSFHGLEREISDLYDLGQAIHDHPNFGKGWVAKLCNWASSQPCDQTDTEFLRLVDVFEDNNYRMKPLIRELFSSPLITQVEYIDAFEDKQASIILSRTNHFCQTIKSRLTKAREATGLPPTELADMCNVGAAAAKKELLPEDEFARGAIDLIQAVNLDPFLVKGYEQLCEAASTSVISYGAGTEGVHYDKIFSANTPENSIQLMVTHILGIDEDDPKNELTYDALQKMYDVHQHETLCADEGLDIIEANQDEVVCGLNSGNNAEVLRKVWVAACSSPSLMSIGF